MATAGYPRGCPKCGKVIFKGDEIHRQTVGGKKTWVHEHCYMPPALEKEIDRLDAEFRDITRR